MTTENALFEELETAVNKLVGEKNQKEKELREALEEARAGLDAATEDSDKYMKAGDLKKYTEAETRKGFYNKRIDHLTNQENAMSEKGFLTEAQRKQLIQQINNEQNRIIREQVEEMRATSYEMQEIANAASFLVNRGNRIVSKINTELMNEEENPYKGMIDNRREVTIADNVDYMLSMSAGVPPFRNNYRFSKFIGGAKFAN